MVEKKVTGSIETRSRGKGRVSLYPKSSGNAPITFKVTKSTKSSWKCTEVHFRKLSVKVLKRSRGPKCPDLVGEITEKSLVLESEKTFS